MGGESLSSELSLSGVWPSSLDLMGFKTDAFIPFKSSEVGSRVLFATSGVTCWYDVADPGDFLSFSRDFLKDVCASLGLSMAVRASFCACDID